MSLKYTLHRLFLSLLVLFISCQFSFSQTATDSPYSRFGIGNIENGGFVQNVGMGSAFIGLQNDTLIPLFINPGNPASYPGIRLTSFEVGVKYTNSTFYTSETSVKKNKSNFNYIAMGFPMGKRMGLVASMSPYSFVGYKVSSYTDVASIGKVKNQYEGDGGLNKVSLGVGIKPLLNQYKKFMYSDERKNLIETGNGKALKKKIFVKKALSSISIGANGSYLFGNISHVSRLVYPAGLGVLNTKQTREANVHDFTTNAGAQVTFEIDSVRHRDMKRNVRLSLGYIFSPQMGLSTTASTIGYTYVLGPFEREFPRDTVQNIKNVQGSIQLPAMHGVGIAFNKGTNFVIAADFEMQMWSAYQYYGKNQGYQNSKRVSIGMQWIPNRFAIGSMSTIKRIHYRLGVKYLDSYLSLNNIKLKEYSVSGGLGVPVGNFKLFTNLNISVEYGTYGTVEKNLIQEKFVRAILGLTFNDRWFIKQKLD